MNTSQFMDKQILDLMNPQEETNSASHISTANGEGGGFGKSKDEIMPNYDFQPIRTVSSSSSPPSSTGIGTGAAGSASAWGSLDSRMGPSNLRSAGVLEPQVLTEVKHKEETFSAPATNNYAPVITVTEIDRVVKKYADNVLHALEGVNARLSQLETRTHHVESSVDDLKLVVGNHNGNTDGKLRHFENILREVQSGVQILRDKQEIVETQLQLSKFQPSSDASPPPPRSQDTSEHHLPPPATPQAPPPPQQQLALPAPPPSQYAPPQGPPLPTPNAPPSQYAPPQGPSLPVPNAPQYPSQLPQSAPPYFPQSQSNSADPTHAPQFHQPPPPPQGGGYQQPPPPLQSPYPPYTNPPTQPGPTEEPLPNNPYGAPPQPQTYPPPPRGPTNAPPQPPYMQQLQQPTGPSPPSSSFYGPPPPSMYNEPQPIPNRPNYGPQVDPYYGGGSPSYRGGMKPPNTSPFTSGSLPTAKVLPQAVPVGSGTRPGSGPGSDSRVPLDDVVEKVAMMGFSREQVRATVRRLTENGQNVDLNVVLDKLMNDGEIMQPQKGWYNR